MNDDELIPLPAVKRITGMGKTFIYGPCFGPRPLKIGRSTRWRKSEVIGWLDDQPRVERACDRRAA